LVIQESEQILNISEAQRQGKIYCTFKVNFHENAEAELSLIEGETSKQIAQHDPSLCLPRNSEKKEFNRNFFISMCQICIIHFFGGGGTITFWSVLE